ncbi:dTMP kinase [Caulobacter vibrioides]|uniref:Thymidylate kinase n=2 Tax=Caulobacter vibrioides TaxID=155892 RepID=KTHY_CAUVC|nr:dTMP kinase [Caulobacter vibrioides]YP_002517273.1 thymidylate kinase [Caulobacter vibrioides NA1000]Q9RQJ9.1 RecName: Full=Thymidylate kinase; AltName: Full=dTMP kinase [Caulobacter vibrioides CB15]QBQ57128.1 dTMP kinase [synthetic Caulobacter sp. 'ethensis']AAF06831.1 thymydilate kinase [Caulobacter vibrioides CB15]AAK23799.1 thymidylate kinase [Caulobacter vibrioides CB15]ACL95365.1 thymidylate kinase [Caulobacter vibrioides NA1000]ATC28699.1 dTMP kinase [Caulobacter vibrioides]
MTQGFFISFEGGEGAGKSTQIRRLADRLKAAGHDVIVTREPGGSPGAEAIRELLVNGAADRWSPVTESLLMYAARRDHIERVIRPGLARGAVVLCDRFADSTRAYQGAGGDAPASLIAALEEHVLGGTVPVLTLILDLPAEVGLQRAEARGGAARFESKGLAFHERLRAGYLEIARREPDRCVVIDADAELDAVTAAISDVVVQRLGL